MKLVQDILLRENAVIAKSHAGSVCGDVVFMKIRHLSLLALMLSFAFPTVGMDLGFFVPLDFVVAILFVMVHFQKATTLTRVDVADGLSAMFLLWIMICDLYNIVLSHTVFGESLRLSAVRTIVHLIKVIIPFLLYRSLKMLLKDETTRRMCLKYFYFVLWGIIIYSFYQFLALTYEWPLSDLRLIKGKAVSLRYGMERVFGIFQEPSHLGHFLIMAIPIVIMLCYRKGVIRIKHIAFGAGWHKMLLIGMSLILVLTLSRGPIIALALGLAVSFPFLGRKAWKRFFRLAATICILAGLFVIVSQVYLPFENFMYNELLNRIVTFVTSYKIGGDRASIGIAADSIRAFKVGIENIVFGVGWGNFAIIEGEINPVRGLFPRALADVGILGLLLMLSFLFVHIYPLFSLKTRQYTLTNKLLSMSILVGLIQMSFFFNHAFSLAYFWFFLALSATQFSVRRVERSL